MMRTHRVLALFTLTLGLAACGEKPQEVAGRQITGNAASWHGSATPFTVSGWTVGDQSSWQAHMQARAQAQNENVRLGSSR